MQPRRKRELALLLAGVAIAAVALDAVNRDRETRTSNAPTSQGADRATAKHPRLVNLAALDGAKAEMYYQAIRGQLEDIYARSDDPVTRAYVTWRRHNRFPYFSSRHGDLLVNNYANETAYAYGRFERAGPMPEGAVIVKDSFAVTRDGHALPGPLFMMEKMPAGFDPTTGDWRFALIGSRGDRIGMTGGQGAELVRFCAECHAKAGLKSDYLFFVPDEARPAGGE